MGEMLFPDKRKIRIYHVDYEREKILQNED